MFRLVIAAVAALAMAACSQSAGTVDAKDPWKTLYPWNHSWKEVHKLPDGVEYVIVRKGDGKSGFPSPADTVKVHYDGRFAKSGERFDASYGGDPAEFTLGGLIPGWIEGIAKMQVGDEFVFYIPWKQAYGAEGRPPTIPPKSDLMFQVELLDIKPALASDAVAWKKALPWPTQSSAVIRRPSGLEYFVVDSGPDSGASPTDKDIVNVYFESRREEDGGVVLSTFEDQQKIAFPMDQLTPGWHEAMTLMRPGDHWMIRVPANLLYGDEGDGRIPPGATVIFEVRLDSIEPNPNPAPPPAPAKPDKSGKATKPGAKPTEKPAKPN
ncbi:MAG TPA: FKBP-type peptidyl-prolyl cis-trans isomerase [Hyphomonadaceae bacterium]|nr:FKBP-type peptidyl-prolyl cis-trans isomerase [Hyphomonadaceae bacterium]